MNKSTASLRCFAHRGGRGHGTENTLKTIQQSLDAGIDGIEIDVWEVAGKLLITHDRLLGRVIQGSGYLLNLSAEQISALRHYDGSKVATLEEVLALVGNRATLNIEIKGPNCAAPVAASVEHFCKAHGVSADHYLMSSFDHHQLYWFKQNAPAFKRGVLVSTIPLDYAACCDALGAYSFHPSLYFVNRQLVGDARKRGLEVFVYTVNEAEDLKMLADLGVTGVFSDYPERVAAFNQAEAHR